MKTRLLLVALPALLVPLAAGVAACGGPDEPAPIGTGGGYPGGSAGFNPGGGGNGGEGASAANGGNGGWSGTLDGGTDAVEEPGPPVCAEEYKRCDAEFTYVGTGSEKSVELRGDFASDGWDKGYAFQASGTSWTATIPVPMNFSFQYKLVIDGTQWIADPTNPNEVDDGVGGKNSVFQAKTCSWWSCVTEAAPLQCAEADRICNYKFQYPLDNQSDVTLMGDFDNWTTGVPMVKDAPYWKAWLELAWGSSVQYKFKLNGGASWELDPANPNSTGSPPNSLLSNIKCGWWSCGKPPTGYDWRDAVLYFVFVDRFLDGDPSNNGAPVSGVDQKANYRGGDWAGVLQKVNDGYFNELGVTALWLTVPMNNTDSMGIGDDGKPYSAYHGYWPTELDQTEGRFGSMAELKAVVDAAHAKGIKVILDYAMNHVHKDSPVYAQHSDWFWPLDFDNKHCVCGEGCSWDVPYDAKRCWFRDYLPDFNFTNAAARKFSIDNALWWINQTGIDGYRLDAVKHIEDQWLLDLRSRVKAEIEPTSGQHFYMVGETYTGDQGLIKYYVNPSMLDGQFDFPMRARLAQAVLTRGLSMSELDGFLNGNDGYYGSQALMSTFIGNHDLPRSIHLAENNPYFGGDVWDGGKSIAWTNPPSQPAGDEPYQRLANAFTLLMTTHGVPLIYYGDEVGLAGAGDPDNRRMMQWSGYSGGQSALLAHLKKLGKIRSEQPALRRGVRSTLAATADTYLYKMSLGTDTVYVVINRGDTQQSVSGLPAGAFTDLLSGGAVSGPTVIVPARSSLILH